MSRHVSHSRRGAPLDRFALAAVTTASVLAAFVAATWIPTAVTPGPLLTWACTYTGTTLALARASGLPPARTLYAATLLAAAALRVLLIGMRHAIDGLLTALTHLTTAGTASLSQKAT